MVQAYDSQIQFLLYSTPEENISVKAIIKNETLWLTQKSMAELFGCSTDNISLHLKNIYKEGELSEETTTEKISVVQKEGNQNGNRKVNIILKQPSAKLGTQQ